MPPWIFGRIFTVRSWTSPPLPLPPALPFATGSSLARRGGGGGGGGGGAGLRRIGGRRSRLLAAAAVAVVPGAARGQRQEVALGLPPVAEQGEEPALAGAVLPLPVD